MAYNLRNRTVRDILLDEDESDAPDVESEDEVDEVSEDDEEADEFVPSDACNDDMEVDSSDAKDASSNSRLLNVRQNRPGRSVSTLRGKNGYLWKTRTNDRSSDRQRQSDLAMDESIEAKTPGPTGSAANLTKFEAFWGRFATR
ncbi:hypothetical protein QAD02_000940 [Eretmocerus hayati]|uniref:Uncharacterized protein n=1 Tax=Eretmocerus hayati TaxID=131215 RepID=A0ACC2NF08_9HYME|nr:hypothetical protein QAD02_000940 [Eretmocerus hayati]